MFTLDEENENDEQDQDYDLTEYIVEGFFLHGITSGRVVIDGVEFEYEITFDPHRGDGMVIDFVSVDAP